MIEIVFSLYLMVMGFALVLTPVIQFYKAVQVGKEKEYEASTQTYVMVIFGLILTIVSLFMMYS